MKTFTAILLVAAFALSSADISLTLRENDFSHTNEQGGYHFGFNDGRQARHEERSPEGIVRGAYRFVDADGQVQTITYTADSHNGFVASGSNIPKLGRIPSPGHSGDIREEVPASFIDETPEVKAAKIEHLEAHKEALQGLGQVPEAVHIEELLVPVGYTPEVAAARVEHINVLNEERARNLRFPIVVPDAVQYHPDYQPYAAL